MKSKPFSRVLLPFLALYVSGYFPTVDAQEVKKPGFFKRTLNNAGKVGQNLLTNLGSSALPPPTTSVAPTNAVPFTTFGDAPASEPQSLGNDETANYTLAAAAPENERALWKYRLSLWEFRRGNNQKAAQLIREGLDIVDARFGKNEPAKRALSYFEAEEVKDFVGEPYERAMANVLNGFYFIQEGRLDVALSCFEQAEIEDSIAEKQIYKSDFVIPFYLSSWIHLRAGNTNQAANLYAQATNSCTLFAPPVSPELLGNCLIVAESGQGPRKKHGGSQDEDLIFTEGYSKTASIQVGLVGGTVPPITVTPLEHLTFQAVTRGGRVMDQVLENKKDAKVATKSGGWGAVLAGGALFAAQKKDPETAAIVLGSGLVLQAVAMAIKPNADIRCWDNLPQFLSIAGMNLPAGRHNLVVEFLDATRQPIRKKQVEVTVPEGKPALIYVSDQE